MSAIRKTSMIIKIYHESGESNMKNVKLWWIFVILAAKNVNIVKILTFSNRIFIIL